MLDIRLIRDTPEVVEAMLRKRGADMDLSHLRDLDTQRRAANTELDELRAQRNAASREIGAAKQRGEDAEAEMAAVRDPSCCAGSRISARASDPTATIPSPRRSQAR